MIVGQRFMRSMLLTLIGVCAACVAASLELAADTAAAIPALPATSSIAPSTTWRAHYEGVASVNDVGWTGTESFVVLDEKNVTHCRWTWQTVRRSPWTVDSECATQTGEVCTFWHTIQRIDGAEEVAPEGQQASCEPFRGAARLLVDGGEASYGYAPPTATATQTETPAGTLLRYEPSDPPLPGKWLAFPAAAQWETQQLSYTIPVGGDLP